VEIPISNLEGNPNSKMRISKPEGRSGSAIDWLDGVSPYQFARDNLLVGRRSAEPDLFGLWDLRFGASKSLGFSIKELGLGICRFDRLKAPSLSRGDF
jgi:hypothetical protein